MGKETICKTIFLADDDDDDCHFFSKILSQVCPGAMLQIATNGMVLLDQLREADKIPDLIVLDLNMPVMNGYDALENIRKSAEFKNLPVVIMTTSNDPADIDRLFDMGASLYAVKPGTFSELQKVIESIVRIDWSKFTSRPVKKDFRILTSV